MTTKNSHYEAQRRRGLKYIGLWLSENEYKHYQELKDEFDFPTLTEFVRYGLREFYSTVEPKRHKQTVTFDMERSHPHRLRERLQGDRRRKTSEDREN